MTRLGVPSYPKNVTGSCAPGQYNGLVARHECDGPFREIRDPPDNGQSIAPVHVTRKGIRQEIAAGC